MHPLRFIIPVRSAFTRAFTLFEVLVSIIVISAIAVVLVPSITSDDPLRVSAASSILASDIEYAQVLTMAHPETPVVIIFEPDKNSYALFYGSDLLNPILRPDTNRPYHVTLGKGRAYSAQDVSFSLVDMPSDTLAFNEQGGLTDITLNPAIVFSSASSTLVLNISPVTGTLFESAAPPSPVNPPAIDDPLSVSPLDNPQAKTKKK